VSIRIHPKAQKVSKMQSRERNEEEEEVVVVVVV